ncbi:MAG: 3'-5' exonuclease [Myxococcota bacterium]|nr:3'-5' exonuclease [Myxococcota bacterium]
MSRNADLPGCFPTGRHYPGIAHLLRVVVSGLCEEFTTDHAFSDLRLISIDTETTGRDPAVDRIVEIACVVWQNGTVVARSAWLVNPERPIPKEASDVHGITDEEVKDKPTFAEIIDEVLEMMSGGVPLAHNAEYDRSVISAELGRIGGARRDAPAVRKSVDWVDSLVWARELHKLEKSKALGEVSQRLGIEIPQAHRALHDAEAALRVMLAFASDVRVPRTYGAFIQEQRRLSRLHDDERRLWKMRAPSGPAPAVAPAEA